MRYCTEDRCTSWNSNLLHSQGPKTTWLPSVRIISHVLYAPYLSQPFSISSSLLWSIFHRFTAPCFSLDRPISPSCSPSLLSSLRPASTYLVLLRQWYAKTGEGLGHEEGHESHGAKGQLSRRPEEGVNVTEGKGGGGGGEGGNEPRRGAGAEGG